MRQIFHNRPPAFRLLLFLIALTIATPVSISRFGLVHGVLVGFDGAVLVFLMSALPLLNLKSPRDIIAHATVEDGTRPMMLLIASLVCGTILVTVGYEMLQVHDLNAFSTFLVIATLGLTWCFANLVYALHYAHLHYGVHGGGLVFPGNDQPDYWDFLYFSFTLGMTFQTSDILIQSSMIRRIVTLHCLAAFVFNLGILGFTINLLGGTSAPS